MGAIGYLKEVRTLHDKHVEKILKYYLSFNFTNGNKSDAKELSVLILELSQTEEGLKYMKEGKQAFRKWKKEKPDVLADLNRLLIEQEGI